MLCPSFAIATFTTFVAFTILLPTILLMMSALTTMTHIWRLRLLTLSLIVVGFSFSMFSSFVSFSFSFESFSFTFVRFTLSFTFSFSFKHHSSNIHGIIGPLLFSTCRRDGLDLQLAAQPGFQERHNLFSVIFERPQTGFAHLKMSLEFRRANLFQHCNLDFVLQLHSCARWIFSVFVPCNQIQPHFQVRCQIFQLRLCRAQDMSQQWSLSTSCRWIISFVDLSPSF